ncbi:hypothetical protein BGX31_011504 [Mortierella sp. GBA43]|nr:hypothetical protein BGX31_011504 [Mortierella sp. GBA43]
MADTLDILIASKPGKTVTVPYDIYEPIFFLIQRIARELHEKDHDIQQRNLYMNGILLDDQQESISRYRVFGTVLTYQAIQSQGMVVYINSFTGKTIALKCSGEHTSEQLQEMIQEVIGLPRDQQRLMFAGKAIEGKARLKDYRISNGSTLQLTLRLCGGTSFHLTPGVMFSDISQTEGVRKLKFSKNAPAGRIAGRGTNVECKCECTPNYRVICRKGRGTIELADSSFTCPKCQKDDRIAPVTIGFVDCKYRFHGIKSTGEQYTSEWSTVTREDCYLMFDPSKQVRWRRLVIESVEISAPENCTIPCFEIVK